LKLVKYYKGLFILAVNFIAIISVPTFLSINTTNLKFNFNNEIYADSKTGNWISISYSSLVNKSTITHSGETIEEIVSDLSRYDDNRKGLVQQYFEPFSILCHDALLTVVEPDTMPLINILSHYPKGSEQPAWVDLFREGHYQIYYNFNKIRLFLKGSQPKNSFERFRSIVRFPIMDIIESVNRSIESVEIYVFENNYEKMEINFNTIPATITIDELDLEPKYKSINLAGIENFISQDVTLEAVEVDEDNQLYFYGKKSSSQSLAGQPLSISDIAVIYRSIFHYGNNAPYISLDSHEDNRYAKVNFGGYLKDTRVGHVVLEADKLFKALSTGLDPNSAKLVKTDIKKKIPDFLTEDERSIIGNDLQGSVKIRYWFYPDSIGTVSNGNIGAILNYNFLADVERTDATAEVSGAIRKTIDHLNSNFSKYQLVSKTFEELCNVGRIMALVNWLREMNIDEKLELDELLSVRLPAFETPEKTKKMLAFTTAAYPGKTILNEENVVDYTKVYYISDLLDQHNMTESDDYFLSVAQNYFTQIDIEELAPQSFIEVRQLVNYHDKAIKESGSQLELRHKNLEEKRNNLDRGNSEDLKLFNDEVADYNDLLKDHDSIVAVYNKLVLKMNNYGLTTKCITSVGGGINLRPKDFRQIVKDKKSPKIQEILKFKNELKIKDIPPREGEWIRSKSKPGGPKINKLPSISRAAVN